MTAIERINQLSHRIFNTSKNETTTARTSNPFASSNFQKNILTEDVFVSSNKGNSKIGFTGGISASSKRIYSTFVGSISDFGNKIIDGIESIKAFGVRMKNGMKEGLINTWNKIYEIGSKEVTLEGTKDFLTRDITSFFGNTREKSITKMSQMNPHTEVKPMLVEALSSLEADMAMIA